MKIRYCDRWQAQKIHETPELVGLNADRYRVRDAIDAAVSVAGEVDERSGVRIAGIILDGDLRLPLLELVHVDHARDVRLHVGPDILTVRRPAMGRCVRRAIAGEIDYAVPHPEHLRDEDNSERQRHDHPGVENSILDRG